MMDGFIFKNLREPYLQPVQFLSWSSDTLSNNPHRTCDHTTFHTSYNPPQRSDRLGMSHTACV